MQVLAAVYGPRVADVRSHTLHDKAVVKCEYAEAAFSTGADIWPSRIASTYLSRTYRETLARGLQHTFLTYICRFTTGSRRQRRGRGDRKSAEMASTIRSAMEQTILLELFPRAQIDISVQVLQADGGILGACINAAMLAAADAGADGQATFSS